jgi:hypothetical protein
VAWNVLARLELLLAALPVPAPDHGRIDIKRVELPGLPPKGDVSDWLEAGDTAERLMQLAEQAPEWEPVEATVKEPLTQAWPTLGKAADHGLAGEIVRAIEPHSEALTRQRC